MAVQPINPSFSHYLRQNELKFVGSMVLNMGYENFNFKQYWLPACNVTEDLSYGKDFLLQTPSGKS